MRDLLRQQLSAAGWKPGGYKGFLQTRRAGIEFQIGQPTGTDRLALRYRYHTERTHAEGEAPLPADASLPKIHDTLTEIYLRIHEKPDYSRVFGGRRRSRMPSPVTARDAESDGPDTQLGFDL